jgi:hypothetical protein
MFPQKSIVRHSAGASILCALCHAPVQMENSKTDEDGQAVHEECYVLLILPETGKQFAQAKTMTMRDAYLDFDKIDMEEPEISSRCSRCGLVFRAEPEAGERVDDVLLRMRAEFEAHQCCV